MKILVTGAVGFIGYNLCKQLILKGEDVIGIDNINDYYDVSIKYKRLTELTKYDNFTFYKLDITDIFYMEELIKNNHIDIIYHLAAMAGVRNSLNNPHLYYNVNVMGTLNILEMMEKYEIGKIVLSSTSSIYDEKETIFIENISKENPMTPYSSSKKSAELLCYTYHKQFGIDVSILRYFTVYGKDSRPDMMPYIFINNIKNGIPINVYGDGNQSRDFTYVDDIVNGTILSGKKVGYEIFNLGGGNRPTSVNEFIYYVEELTGKKSIINYLPKNNSDMIRTCANIDKSELILGWKPNISVYDGIKKIVNNQ
jgi:UDP-glucuronate 4-epimerase